MRISSALFLILSFNIYAIDCEELLSSFRIKVNIETNKFDSSHILPQLQIEPDFVDIAKSHIHNINEMVSSILIIPNELEMNIARITDHMSASNYNPTINIANFFLDIVKKGDKEYFRYKGTEASFPILAHEYGHIIFNENIKAKFKRYFDEKEQIEDWLVFAQVKMGRLDNDYNTLSKILENSTKEFFGKEITSVKKQSDALSLQVDQMLLRYARLNMINMYSELFADVVAVLFYEDGKVMADSVNFQRTTKDSFLRTQARDFTHTGEHSVWDITEEHEVLSPVRSFLWQESLSTLKDNESKAKELEKIIKVVLHELNVIYNHPDFDLRMQELNERFISHYLQL